MFDQDFAFGHCIPHIECYINKSAVQDLITDHLNSMLYLRISKLWRKENLNLEGACNIFVWRRFHFDPTAHLAFVCGKDDDRRCMHHAHLQRPPAIVLSPPCPLTNTQACPFHACAGKGSASLACPACSTMFNGVCMCFHHSVNQHHIRLSLTVPHRQQWNLEDSMKQASSSRLDRIRSIPH